MKKIKFLSAILVIALISVGCSQSISSPDTTANEESQSRALVTYPPLNSVGNFTFPQSRTDYNIVKPSNKNQTQLNDDVKDFYAHWKSKYLREATITSNGSIKGYIVEADGTGGAPESWNGHPYKTHSEATGYGMVITALMGEQQYFDGLYVMFDNFRSPFHNDLMSWVIPQDESQAREKTHNATDGDIDIAYGLLLADKQWGSAGSINYKAQAMRTIAAVKEKNFNHTTMRLTRGSWDPGSSAEKYSTRSSDWIVAQFQTFYEYTEDQFWLNAINEIYNIIDKVIAKESPNTHLMPDFVEGLDPQKATAPFLEKESDDDYAWNSCRYPWRIGMGYGHFGDIRSKNALDGFVDWSIANCSGSIWSHMAGYRLDGVVMKKVDDNTGLHTNQDVDYSSNAFSAPLVLAATHDAKNQSFINDSWTILIRKDDWNTFFGDTITMQCLLYMSGNWWVPEPSGSVDLPPTKPVNLAGTSVDVIGTTEAKINLTWTPSTDDNGPVTYEIYQAMNPGIRLVRQQEITSNGSATTRGWANDVTVELIVAAIDNAGQKTYSDKIAVTTPPFENDIPTLPTNLNVTNITETSAKVTWTPSQDVGLMGHKISISGGAEVYYHSHQPNEYTFTGLVKNTQYTISIKGSDNWSEDGPAATVTFKTAGGSGGDVPVDPAATGKPNSFNLSYNNWNNGPNYKITGNMWWGNNATVVKLYENGALIETLKPNFSSPNAQKVEFSFTNKPAGSYTYKVEAINQHGTTTTQITYTVK